MTRIAPTTLTTKLARHIGFIAAFAALIAAMVVPATGMAAAPVKFGAKLNPTVQPSNGSPGLKCSQEAPATACTMIQNEAYGRPDGGELAPKTGTIKKIRVIAADAGSFRPQIAKVKRSTLFGTNEAKVVYTGPKLSYTGQTEANEESGAYKVETFDVNIPVKKGQQLALRGNISSMVRCSSGGDNTLLYTPPLLAGKPFKAASETDGCWILMEAVIR
ncbi:MAG: hypothetical protein JJE35_02790 [Thermoleophilia bacterium]|nr:hypothetical protein [Thermoleophilia bacterium]